jgi:pyruvate formate lyase activating enzyme
MQSGLIFNIQKYSVHDGPGIRTTVFLKGCPLCCVWCHNPESISPRREVVRLEGRCALCGECRQACPLAAHATEEKALPARNPDCTFCEACVEACPTGARQVVGREMSVVQVMEEILRDRIFYEESAGGVTFSGGEPLMQPDFLLALLEACRAQALHTAVDTCGFGCSQHLLAVGRLSSLMLYDLKFMDEERHRHYCGVSNRPILENLRTLAPLHGHIWIRVPVIPGVNDDGANLEGIARFAAGLQGVRQVNLLPYHRTGVEKFRRLGKSPPLTGLDQPSQEQLRKALRLFEGFGLTVRLGG